MFITNLNPVTYYDEYKRKLNNTFHEFDEHEENLKEKSNERTEETFKKIKVSRDFILLL